MGSGAVGGAGAGGRLILVRHGQTTANVAKKLDTLPPGAPLTDLGEQQAEDLARRAGAAGIAGGGRPAALVSSVALRAKQTARPVSSASGVGLEVLDGLHEVQAGDLEGRSDEAAHRIFVDVFRHWYRGDLDERLPGGESGHDALGRYLPVLDELRAGFLGGMNLPDGAPVGTGGPAPGAGNAPGAGDVVVVSHGAIIRLAVTAMSDVSAEFALANHLSNTDAVVLAPRVDGGWHLQQWADKTPPFAAEDRRGDSAFEAAEGASADDPMG